jgi:hypothetical protein
MYKIKFHSCFNWNKRILVTINMDKSYSLRSGNIPLYIFNQSIGYLVHYIKMMFTIWVFPLFIIFAEHTVVTDILLKISVFK